MPFHLLDSTMHGADESYSTKVLDDLRDNTDWVRQNRGSHVTMVWEAYSNAVNQKSYERPFVSATGPAIFLRVPWYVGPRLKALHFRFFCRVSNGERDASAGETGLIDERVDLSAKLLGDIGPAGDGAIAPEMAANGAPRWQFVELTYDITNRAINRGTYDTLALMLKSRLPLKFNGTTYDGADFDAVGRVDGAGIDTGAAITTFRAKAAQDGFYAEGTEVDVPVSGANEITATLGCDSPQYNPFSDVDHVPAKWFDHVRKQPLQFNRAMYIWPPADSLADVARINTFHKFHVPYIQFRAIEIWEEFE